MAASPDSHQLQLNSVGGLQEILVPRAMELHNYLATEAEVRERVGVWVQDSTINMCHYNAPVKNGKNKKID